MLDVRHLSLSYGDTPVLSELDLHVSAGEFTSLVGPSGSGKSSLLRAVTKLHAPSQGAVSVEVDEAQIGFLFQDDALLPWRRVRDNVALGLKIRGVAKKDAFDKAEVWLERLGLAGYGDRYPRQLSGGQRKRVALAQVLALQPRLLLMDEPFASLDAIVRHRITDDLLGWVEREQMTVLLVTHDLEEAISLSDSIYLLSQGPGATIRHRYEVPLPRPRNLVKVRSHPAFAPLYEQLWHDLEREVDPARADTSEQETPHKEHKKEEFAA